MPKFVRRINPRRGKRRLPKGVIHIQATFNNLILTVIDIRGQVISWSSTGACGFKSANKSTPFAAQTAAENATQLLVDQGMKQAEIMISGPGPGRDTTLRAIRISGIVLSFVRDVTLMPHNGCRSP